MAEKIEKNIKNFKYGHLTRVGLSFHFCSTTQGFNPIEKSPLFQILPTVPHTPPGIGVGALLFPVLFKFKL
jgi:hypothetical protein